jgi:DNA polymerase V
MNKHHDTAPLFSLVDCNNFYCSAERVFNPRLEGRPLVVLSANDGNAIARSQEAKDLGVKMGTPWYQLKDLVRHHRLIGLSSNFVLYGDISARVVQVLSQFTPDYETYSVDESFLRVERMRLLWPSFTAMGQAIKSRVVQWTGVPVCVGFGPSRTLAKLSNFIAKKNPQFGGVFDMTAYPPADLDRLLSSIDVGEVWGVGNRNGEKLRNMGINTVQDLRRTPPKLIRAHFSVVMERTATELQGIPCMDIEDIPPAKKTIVSSKSFGLPVTTRNEMMEALATFTSRAAEKLRAQQSVCGVLQVFILTNQFRQDEPQYSNAVTIPLVYPTSDTRELAAAAAMGLDAIFRQGFMYKKCGVMLLDLKPAGILQRSLFDAVEANAKHSAAVMAALDGLNTRFGRDTIKVASTGTTQRWAARAENRTQCFTTRWSELPKAMAR